MAAKSNLTRMRGVVFSAIAAITLLFGNTSADGDEIKFADQNRAITDGLFDGDQSGMFLWARTEKFCGQIKRQLPQKGKVNDTILLFSNETQTAFHTGKCTGGCSLLEENMNLRECRSALGGQKCLLYAAIRGNVVYDLTVNAENRNLDEVCDDR